LLPEKEEFFRGRLKCAPSVNACKGKSEKNKIKKNYQIRFHLKKIIFPKITFNNTKVNGAKVNHLQKE
jgi:hypothetical protein